MRARSVVVYSLMALIVAFVALTVAFPAVDDLWVENPFWNGLSIIYSEYQPVRLSDYVDFSGMINPFNATILILGPSKPFMDVEVAFIRDYLEEGGRVVLTDDYGTGNSLLEGLGLDIRFSGELLQDGLFKERRMMPRIMILEDSVYTAGVKEIVMNYPTVLNGTSGSQVVAYASYFSTFSGSSDEYGPYPVVAVVEYGRGRLVLVSDSSLFINSMIEKGGNSILLENFLEGVVVVDEVHSVVSRLAEFKAWLAYMYVLMNHPEVKYSLAAVLVVGVFKVRWVDVDEEPDEVEEVLRRHPEWSRRELEELREARRKARGLQ